MKRGHAEFLLVALVLVIAAVGFYTMVGASSALTGAIEVPQARGYGGAVRGIADVGSRAFYGRAFEISQQSCFDCSCLEQGITASDQSAAARVCSENCGGQIVGSTSGNCR